MQTCEEDTRPVRSRAPDRPRRRRTLVPVGVGVLLCALVAGLTVWYAGREVQFFPEARAFWDPVPASPRLDPDSSTIVSVLAEPGLPVTLNTGAYGQPIYYADEDTPRHRLRITRQGRDQWGDNVLAHADVPIPDHAVPSSGTDGKLVVVDRDAGRVYDLWRAARTAEGWQAEWGGIYPLAGDGSSRRVAHGQAPHHVPWPEPVSRGTGSGISSLAGVVRAEELAQGEIPHALAFSTDRGCGPAQTGPYRWPATSTDGWTVGQPCIPEGARVQLDPTLDLSSIPGITPLELMVGRALQRYGAYPVDVGGARTAVIVEVAHTAAQLQLYRGLGLLDDDYHALRHLPTDRLRVLAQWDGR